MRWLDVRPAGLCRLLGLDQGAETRNTISLRRLTRSYDKLLQ